MNTSQQNTARLLRTEPYKIGHFLGFKDLNEHHNDWLIDWLWKREDSTTQAHRGSFKTTDLALFMALNILAHRNQTTLFMRKTDKDVSEVIKLVSKIIQSATYRKLVKRIYNADVLILKETADEIHTSLYTGTRGSSQLVGMGINGSITGKHADTVITDDIVNLKDRISRAEREHTKLVYQELQNVKNRGGKIINTGTPWHKDDAFTLMPNIRKFDCRAMGIMSEAEIRELQQRMSPSLFAANYMLKHIADENAMFTDARFTADTERIYNGICHIDAAYGGEDSTAFTVIAEEGSELVVFGKKYEKHVDDCLDDIMRLKAKYRAGTTWTERNADKGYLDKQLKERGDVSKTYHEQMNKHIKISTYLKENWRRVLFLEDTDPEYIAEILDYTEHAAHDDCPDGLASAIRQLGKKPMTVNRKVSHGL